MLLKESSRELQTSQADVSSCAAHGLQETVQQYNMFAPFLRSVSPAMPVPGPCYACLQLCTCLQICTGCCALQSMVLQRPYARVSTSLRKAYISSFRNRSKPSTLNPKPHACTCLHQGSAYNSALAYKSARLTSTGTFLYVGVYENNKDPNKVPRISQTPLVTVHRLQLQHLGLHAGSKDRESAFLLLNRLQIRKKEQSRDIKRLSFDSWQEKW